MKKKQKIVKNKKTNATIKKTAFNPRYIIWIFCFALALWGNIYLFIEENKISWFLLLAFLASIVALSLDAVYYIFTKQEIYFVRFWGYKWRLPWLYVTGIIKHGFWYSSGFREFMGYEVFYNQPYKGKSIQKTLTIALTPTVKKCLDKFYIGEITGETKPCKRK